MIWIDKKYANQLGNKLERFKVKQQEPFIANCRCPFCGDSEFSKTKARGYLTAKGGKILYYCHNCHVSITFAHFLESVDPVLYSEYLLEVLLEKGYGKKKEADKEVSSPDMTGKFVDNPLKKLKKISSLEYNHPAKLYVERRNIPHDQHFRLFYTPRFVEYVNSLLPDKLSMKEHPRLILPFLDANGAMFGFQGRSFDPKEKMRYITIMLDENRGKVFGLDRINTSSDVFVLEGPIDSLFVPNAVAMAGSDAKIAIDPDKLIWVYDNEPRNPVIVKKMRDKVTAGSRVVVFPSSAKSKDINDMILNKEFDLYEISGMLYRNAFHGIEASLRINEWSRV